MANKKIDWFGAGAISAAVILVIAAILWGTSNLGEHLAGGWARLLVVRLLIGVVVWVVVGVPNRRRLGLLAFCELGILLVVGFGLLGLGRILGDYRVAPQLAAVGLGGLSNAMFLASFCVILIPLRMAVHLMRLSAIVQRARSETK